MSTLLISVRRYGLTFLFVSGLLLVIRLAIPQFGPNADLIVFAVQALDTVLLIVSVAFSLFIVILLYWLIGLAIGWSFRSLFKASAMQETHQMNRLFGVLAVALFFGGLLQVVFDVGRRLVIGLFSDVPTDMMAGFREGMNCIEATGSFGPEDLDSRCVAAFFSDASDTIQRAAIGIFGQSGLAQIPPVQLISAVALFAIVAIVTSRVRSDLDRRTQFWLAYGGVAAFATYLTLSAILAVPLLSEDQVETPRPAEELQTTLAGMVPQATALVATTTETENMLAELFKTPPPENAAENQIGPQFNLLQSEFLSYARRTAQDADTQLIAVRLRETQLRQSVKQTIENQLQAAVIAYDSEITVRRGQREASRHFQDLRSWFQYVIDDAQIQLGRCSTALDTVKARYRTMHEVLGAQIAQGHDGTKPGRDRFVQRINSVMDEENRPIRNLLRAAEVECETASKARYVPPNRRDYGSFLGVVGLAASWLLSTESMEVTLITGLIGFGLLGALVAQFVKSGGSEEFDIARIATVVFSGFTAAIVVYVGAYGGLAIASTSGTDPNPYVVFGACLVGAVFSAEIWDRAKAVFFGDNGGGGGGSGEGANS